jgi:hypothetical protein
VINSTRRWRALPYFDFLILRAACNCILHQANVVAPLDITNPVIMSQEFLCDLELIVNEVPKLDLSINPT